MKGTIVTLVVLVLALVMAGHVSAQILGSGLLMVYDAKNDAQNMLQLAQSVVQTANSVLELEPLSGILISEGMAQDLADLGAIVENATALSGDITTLNEQIHQLFGLDNVPMSVGALQERIVAMRDLAYRVRCYAIEAQALVSTMASTVKHLTGLVQSIQSLVGNKAAQQTLAQLEASTGHTLAVMEVQNAAWQRADTLDRMQKDVVQESIMRIEAQRFGDWKVK